MHKKSEKEEVFYNVLKKHCIVTMQNNAVRIHFFPKQIRLKELVLFLFPVILNAEHWLKTQHGYFFYIHVYSYKKKDF